MAPKPCQEKAPRLEYLTRSYLERDMGSESYQPAGSFLCCPQNIFMKELIKGLGIILIMWMIVSAGMVELTGKAGVLWGAVITCVVVLGVHIYNKK